MKKAMSTSNQEYIENLRKYDLNTRLQEVLEIQLDPKEGSEHWLDLEKKLNLDIKNEIKSIDDLPILEEALLKFDKGKPEYQKEFSEYHLRSKTIEHFVPKKYLKDLDVCLSSATRGLTKIIPWHEDSSREIVNFYEFYFDYNKFPRGEKWLIIGPYGLFEKHLCNVAKKFDGIPIPIGIESWGSKNIKDKNKIIERFEPTLGRIMDIFKVESVGVLATATEMAEMLPNFVDIKDIKALYLTGTGTNFQRIERLFEIYNLKSFGVGYGHSMWGPAVHIDDGTRNLNYFINKSQALQKVVDPQDITKELKYGEEGRVKSYILRNEFFWINLDRDFGIKIPGNYPFNWDGVRNVRSD
ncbi:MAG: hypothetical protein QXL86_00535 [Candidatus Aenigmatarchaeota archaeon]